MNFCVVMTTIQPPTPSARRLHERVSSLGGRLVVAGDKKGPARFELPRCDFLSLADQQAGGYALAGQLPVGHYARKNIGYLHAMRAGAGCIYETDDDNAPLPSWAPRAEKVSGARKISGDAAGWVNVYRYFTDDLQIWPRGLPLNQLAADTAPADSAEDLMAPIQQGLVNGSPDVDAVWRLTQDRPFDFDDRPSLWLAPGQWCPFNAQSTWWWPVAYPLLYIPCHCSFRMCDIWRSFIAQRCLWAMGAGIVFHGPDVFQDRNAHNLMNDFEDEIPGYLNNSRISGVLGGLLLSGIPGNDLRTCYAALTEGGFFPAEELTAVDLWLADLEKIHA